MVEVRIDDIGKGSSYDFKVPAGWKDAKWATVPRKGDYLLDLNEFKYEVIDVVWYEPHMVYLKVIRRLGV